jgi:hypothetical protein
MKTSRARSLSSDLLPSVLCWALGQATSDEELDRWWRQHKQLITDLSEADRARLVMVGREARARIKAEPTSKTASFTRH